MCTQQDSFYFEHRELLHRLNIKIEPEKKNCQIVIDCCQMNAKEEMTWSFRRRISEEIQALEKETGVHLDHYHKLRIENKDIDKHFIFT